MPFTYEYPHPAVTTDIVVFTISRRKLRVLLIERGEPPYRGRWALPGGFVQPDETLDECAARELREEAGVHGIYLEQLYTLGDPGRDPRERVITVAYFALVPSDLLSPVAASDAADVGWFDSDDLPDLAFDHEDIIELGYRRLAAKLDYSTLAFQFLPAEFTLTDLQDVYEIVGREKIDKRNFRKRILALGMIEETGEMRRDVAHRPAKLYRLKEPLD